MGAAEVISFEEVRARKQWDALRHQLHERFDQWLDGLEEQLHEPQPTVAQVTETVWNLRHALTGGMAETIVAHAHQGEYTRKQVPCPQCNGLLTARAPVRRTVETMGGSVQRERPYCYCRSCCGGLSPLDAVVGLSTGRIQPDVQKAAAKLVTEVPYDAAHTLLGDLTGVRLGSERMHTLTNQVAEGLTVLDVTPTRDEIERRIAEVAAGSWRRPVLVLGIDGAYVPTRPDSAREHRPGPRGKRAKRARWRGQWRDAKGFRFSLLHGDRIVHLLSWHQVHNERELGEALRQVSEAGVIPAEKVRLCVVADGGEWRGKHVQVLFPQARQVLDYEHCAQYIHRKFICHVRLKRSGAWWYEVNSNQMLALRCAKYNGTLEQVFACHQQRLWKT